MLKVQVNGPSGCLREVYVCVCGRGGVPGITVRLPVPPPLPPKDSPVTPTPTPTLLAEVAEAEKLSVTGGRCRLAREGVGLLM